MEPWNGSNPVFITYFDRRLCYALSESRGNKLELLFRTPGSVLVKRNPKITFPVQNFNIFSTVQSSYQMGDNAFNLEVQLIYQPGSKVSISYPII